MSENIMKYDINKLGFEQKNKNKRLQSVLSVVKEFIGSDSWVFFFFFTVFWILKEYNLYSIFLNKLCDKQIYVGKDREVYC